VAPTAPAGPLVVVTGTVTDRIDGSPITGSTITYDGSFAGRGVTTAQVVDGRYELGVPLGGYKVTISGPSHVRHQTLNLGVNAGGAFDFTVLEWGSQRFGAVYDERFQAFFDNIGRGARDAVWRWDPFPDEIFVDQDPRLSSEAFRLFMEILSEVNRETVPALFGGRIGPLTIREGSALSLEDIRGRIVITFQPGVWAGAPSCLTSNETIIGCGLVRIAIEDVTSDKRKWITHGLAHELFHAAFMTHDGGHFVGMPTSIIQSDDAMLSAEDRLAAYLVYHPGTRPGNRAPDDNPDYHRP
jgi:hypothetical protein